MTLKSRNTVHVMRRCGKLIPGCRARDAITLWDPAMTSVVCRTVRWPQCDARFLSDITVTYTTRNLFSSTVFHSCDISHLSSRSRVSCPAISCSWSFICTSCIFSISVKQRLFRLYAHIWETSIVYATGELFLWNYSCSFCWRSESPRLHDCSHLNVNFPVRVDS